MANYIWILYISLKFKYIYLNIYYILYIYIYIVYIEYIFEYMKYLNCTYQSNYKNNQEIWLILTLIDLFVCIVRWNRKIKMKHEICETENAFCRAVINTTERNSHIFNTKCFSLTLTLCWCFEKYNFNCKLI